MQTLVRKRITPPPENSGTPAIASYFRSGDTVRKNIVIRSAANASWVDPLFPGVPAFIVADVIAGTAPVRSAFTAYGLDFDLLLPLFTRVWPVSPSMGTLAGCTPGV